MEHVRLDNVHIAMGEVNPDIRRGLRTALFAQGARNIIDCAKVDELIKLLDDIAIDLVVCDTELPGGDFCDIVRRARNHLLGRNPFVVIIATTADAATAGVQRALNSGVDDLLVKPISVGTMLERVGKLVTARKLFVVTHDYVGPDRRTAVTGRGEKNPLVPIEVPNTLRRKTEGTASPDELQALIDEAVVQLNSTKMQRHTTEISFLANRVVAGLRQKKSIYELRSDLDRLTVVGRDLVRRMADSPMAHAADLAGSLATVSDRALRASGGPSRRDADLLVHLAIAIDRAVNVDGATVETAQKITETIARNFQKK